MLSPTRRRHSLKLIAFQIEEQSIFQIMSLLVPLIYRLKTFIMEIVIHPYLLILMLVPNILNTRIHLCIGLVHFPIQVYKTFQRETKFPNLQS